MLETNRASVLVFSGTQDRCPFVLDNREWNTAMKEKDFQKPVCWERNTDLASQACSGAVWASCLWKEITTPLLFKHHLLKSFLGRRKAHFHKKLGSFPEYHLSQGLKYVTGKQETLFQTFQTLHYNSVPVLPCILRPEYLQLKISHCINELL